MVSFASKHLDSKLCEIRLELASDERELCFAKSQYAVMEVTAAFLQLGELGILPFCQDMVFIGMVSCVTWLCNVSLSSRPH